MALVLRGARAVGLLKQVATGPLAQVRRVSVVPKATERPSVWLVSRHPVCSYEWQLVALDDATHSPSRPCSIDHTPDPHPIAQMFPQQVTNARAFSATAAARAGMGTPVPAHAPPTSPVRAFRNHGVQQPIYDRKENQAHF
jgi:hypothetical protein|tara:strand:- start:1271 stop:1693 length:423 start_codon:yes stop_codon:yes gene_type:complete